MRNIYDVRKKKIGLIQVTMLLYISRCITSC